MVQGIARLAPLLLLILAIPARAEQPWEPISPEELKMTSEPKAPKAPAIYLMRKVDRDDAQSTESVYLRIKVLTDEGRAFGNVEIAYIASQESIRALQARVVHADGSIVEFDGTIYDKPLLKAHGVKQMAKSFTLPGVDVGSIIEYRYRRQMRYGWIFDSRWLLSADLFTRYGKFSLRPADDWLLRWSWPIGLPPDTTQPLQTGGVIRLETHDVPAFVSEEYMPPENAMKFRVEFVYADPESNQRNEDDYWKAQTKRAYGRVKSFARTSKTLEQEVARLVQPGDSPETQARKLYARAQQLRNLSFERRATEQEVDREKLATNDTADDVLKHGYGDGDEVTLFFYALLRAAKIDASVLLVSTRDDYIFDPRMMNGHQLNTCVVMATFGNDTMYLDPGVSFMPFGYLPWNETGVQGLRLGPHGAVEWAVTSLPGPAESRVERKVVVKLDTSGTLEGKVTATYTGLEASRRRIAERNEDATERRKFLEDEIEADVPTGIDVKLTNSPDWTGAETPLVAEFEFSVPGWAAAAGNRALVPVGLFGGSEKHTFEHGARVHPLYFSHPYQHTDEISIELPPGWQVASMPKPRAVDIKVIKYGSSAQLNGTTLTLKRELLLNTIMIQQKFYPQVHDFFQAVRAGDEDQIVITRGAAPRAAQN
ncbi:MAG TPA: DUF3857 domain-containing protein [Steroidobacteraceae bacterium]|nr:DUF3857 domain-containing protein [Steroidobacteraceae bacterium]